MVKPSMECRSGEAMRADEQSDSRSERAQSKDARVAAGGSERFLETTAVEPK